jgi:hypothetical protein
MEIHVVGTHLKKEVYLAKVMSKKLSPKDHDIFPFFCRE